MKDIPSVLDLCEKHHDSVAFGLIPFSRKKVYSILERTIRGNLPEGVLLVSEDKGKIVGIFLATKAEVSFSEEAVASELAFWLLPGYRKSRRVLDLVAAFEYWAREIAKVKYCILSKTPEEDTTERSYRALGYSIIETNYLKKL